MSLRARASQEASRGIGLFAVAFVILAVVVAMLSQIGLPAPAASVLLGGGTLVSFVAIGVVTRTMNLQDFEVAVRSVPATLNGMATAAAFLASTGFLGLTAAFFAGSATVFAVVAGWTVGFLTLAVLVAPFLRRAGAVSVADFLAIRFGSATVRFAAVIVTLACSAAFLVAEIAIAGEIAAGLFAISARTGIVIVLAVILISTLLGGMRAVTMTATAQYVVLAIGFLTPVTILSLQQFSFPLPQLSYGFALREAADIAALVATEPTNRFLPLPDLDGFTMVALAGSLAAGVASLPHIAMRSATAASVSASRRSAGWALLFVTVIVATAPAYAAFSRLAILADEPSRPVDAVMIVLSLPVIANLSPAASALVGAGALAAILAAATALLFAIATAIGHDLFSGILDRHGPPGRRLVVTRVALIAATGLAGWYAMQADDDLFALAATSASLAAAGLFPALLLGIWWRRATAFGALAGILLGFGAAAAYVVMVLFHGMAPWQPLGDTGTPLPPAAAAFLGIPVGLLAMVFVSHVTPAATAERIQVINAIQRPTAEPLVDD